MGLREGITDIEMGRYKDYREPRRRGYDDEPSSGGDESAPVTYAPPAQPQQSESIGAVVKWFDVRKGFGFVSLVGGGDAFLPARALKSAGVTTIAEGTRLLVRAVQAPKGAQVTEVLTIEETTAAPGTASSSHPARRADRGE